MADSSAKVLEPEFGKASSEVTKEGMGRCTVGLFTDFLFGLSKRQWSGCVTVELADSVKKTIYFRRGEIVFATSGLMDDRLGEVAYRRGLISLDQLFDTSVKVEANVKFGQLLMNNKVFSKLDLWDALKVQILEIIKSIMLEDTLFFEIQPNVQPGSVIMFDDDTATVLDRTYSFGCMYRDFSAGVKPTTKIKEIDGAGSSVPQGFFLGDMFKIMVENGTVEGYLQQSRLSRSYSLMALMDVVNYGYCRLDPDVNLSFDANEQSDIVLSKINYYAQVLELASKFMKEESIEFPVQDLSAFAHSLNSPTFLSLFLDDQGRLAPNSVNCILSRARSSHKQSEYYARSIEALVHFLFQISSDVLSPTNVDRMRREMLKGSQPQLLGVELSERHRVSQKPIYQRKSVTEGEFYVDGLSAVSEYARFAPEKVKKVIVRAQNDKEIMKTLSELFDADKLSEVLSVQKKSNDENKSPVSAVVTHEAIDWDDFASRLDEKGYELLVLLDQVTDTRNLGAIVRSAAFFGSKAVVVLNKRQTLLTPSAVQTAAGGFALVDLVAVTNLSRTIEQLKENHYWIFGADMTGQDVATLRSDYKKLAIVLGAEDTGLSQNVRKHCDGLIKIPGPSGLDSLNVSVAAGILLNECVRKLS